MQISERWTTRTLADGKWIRRDFGSLSLLVMNYHEEWRVATYAGGAPEGTPEYGVVADAPTDVTWQRWDHDPKDTRLQFIPAFPNMPVVARPYSVLNLSPKGKATFFVGIPAWIEVIGECQGEMLMLTEIPTETLSKTWHGSPLAGQLGFALKTFARRVFEAGQWPLLEILCPISIVNDGESTLPFDRLYLQTDHLSVFEKDDRLWSNAARIRIAATDTDMSNITYAPRPSEPNENAVEITAPRKGKIRRSTFQSTFAKVLGQFNPMEMDS